MKLPSKWERVSIPVLVLGIGFLAALPLWKAGFLNTRIVGESPYLLMRVQQLYSSLREGVFPVRWMPDGAYGYGYPFFNFYAAMPYYVAAGFHFLGVEIVPSIKLTQTFGFVLGAVGVYFWTRRHFRHRLASMAAAALFTFAPMHMINVYVRGDSLSEFWAMATYPLLLWAVDRVIETPRARRIALLAFCYAALMLSHNISALIFSPLLGLYIVWRMRSQPREWRGWIALGSGLALGLGLSIWFWLPALAERNTLQMGDFLTGFFDWRNNFLDKGFVQTGWVFNYGVDAFRLGLWQTAIVAIGGVALAVLLIRRWRLTHLAERAAPRGRPYENPDEGRAKSNVGLWAVIAFGICVIMTLSISSWAYEHVPLLAYLQFPWRWLSIGALVGAVIGTYTVEVWQRQSIRWIMGGIVIGVTAITALGGMNLNFIPLTDADITPSRFNEAEYYSGDIGTTVRADYLPIAVHPRPFSGPAILNHRTLKVMDGNVIGSMIGSGAVWQSWQMQVSLDPSVVAIPTFYWPGWTATLEDGSPLPVSGIDGLGWIQVTVPKGDHTLTFRLGETPTRWMADALAGLAVLAWLALMIKGSIRREVRKPDPYHWLAVGSVFLLAMIIFTLSAPSSSGAFSPQAAQFLTASYRHTYQAIRFKNGGVLQNYTYSSESVSPGGQFAVRLEGNGLDDAHLELIPPMVNIWGYDAALVAETIPKGQSTITLGIPPNAAPGLYFVRLSVGDEAYDLTPIRILPPDRPDQNTTVSPGLEDAKFGDALRLLDVSTAAVDRGRLNLYLRWSVLRPITRSYGLSVRFRSPAGIELAKSDAQIGVYGVDPPAYWPMVFTDWLSLPGLDGLPPGGGYQLTVAVFDGDQLVGQADVRNVIVRNSPTQDSTATPSAFEGVVTLQKAQVEQGADLPIVCQWSGPIQGGWHVRWQLSSDKGNWETATPLAPGAEMEWWRPNQHYKAIIPLAIPVDLTPGSYVVLWSIADGGEQDVTAGKVVGTIQIMPTSRQFAPPSGVRPLSDPIIYGNMISLWSAQSDKKDSRLTVRLTWKAIAKPDRDYTYFIHVQRVDAPTPAAQVDTMPRQNSYPTSMWLRDEYISDEATVNLTGLAPGTYNVWIGWYDPLTGKRLATNLRNGDGRYLIGQINVP